jgi:hypothetical protein
VAIYGKKKLIRFLANLFPKKQGIRDGIFFFKIFLQIDENSPQKKQKKQKKNCESQLLSSI